MCAENTNEPSPEALRDQLKELNNRSRWYSGQLWYIPFAYFGLVALILGNVLKTEAKEFCPTALLACAILGVFVFWHMLGIKDGELRAITNLQKVEGFLHLDRTAEIKDYTRPFFVAVALIAVASAIAGILSSL